MVSLNGECTDIEFLKSAGIDEMDTVRIDDGAVPLMGTIREILFMGAGTSTCVPNVACLAAEPPHCLVCLECVGRAHRTPAAMLKYGGPPAGRRTRNARTNPSVAIRYAHSDGTLHTLLIDCGKSFYVNALRSLLPAGVRTLDGVLLTHGHADAILGLDDLRHWAGHQPAIQAHVDVYCDASTFNVVATTFPYLVDPRCATGGGEVGTLRFHIFDSPTDNDDQEVTIMIGEMPVRPLRVGHGTHADGAPYYANGFLMHGLAYLSDIGDMPAATLARIPRPLALLVVDCLFMTGAYKSHYCWPQAQRLIAQLKPQATVLVGMAHTIDYYRFQRQLIPTCAAADGVVSKLLHRDGNTYVGFDGMLIRWGEGMARETDIGDDAIVIE